MMSDNLLKYILVVDDDKMVRSIFLEFFCKLGYDCKNASDSSQALEILHKHSFDLVVSDIAMPGMDGIQFMKEAKKFFPHLDFIIMTGYSSEYIHEDIIHAGASDYLVKPYTLEELLVKIERIKKEKRIKGAQRNQ